MNKPPILRYLALCGAVALTLCASSDLAAADKSTEKSKSGKESQLLFDPNDAAQVASIVMEKAEYAIVESGKDKVLQGTFPLDTEYPTLSIKPVDGPEWDLTGKEGVEVDVTNKSNVTLNVAMRVDNAGDWKESPWSTESVSVAAGETAHLQVRFGLSNGGQPSFALDPAHIIAIKLFVVKPAETAVVEFKDLRPF